MDISPGRGFAVPPAIAADETVWWGERKGLSVIMGFSPFKRPRTEYILVHSKASSKVRGGSTEGRRLASIDLPEPGGPIISMLCPPAAATVMALFALS